MQVRELGPRAALAEVGSAAEAGGLAVWARAVGVAAVDVVPAARTVLFDGVDDLPALRARLAGWTGATDLPDGPLVELPTTYGGADLAAVARHWGVTEREVVRRHTSTAFTSAFCGFAPGFAYLTGLPAEWTVPRRSSPRPRVPAGAVALAGEYCGVYPSTSPGGWQLLGRTDVPLWDVGQDRPALLAPGTRVRFVEVS